MVSVMLRQPGAYRGKWIAFRPVLRVPAFPRFVAIECLRCRPGTADPGRAGWYYRRGEVGRYGAQLCAGCLEPSRGPSSRRRRRRVGRPYAGGVSAIVPIVVTRRLGLRAWWCSNDRAAWDCGARGRSLPTEAWRCMRLPSR